MLQNIQSQVKSDKNTKNQENNKFDLKFYYSKIYNKRIRLQLKDELRITFGWAESTLSVYLSRGISSTNKMIPKILEIINKYIEKERLYQEKQSEMNSLIN